MCAIIGFIRRKANGKLAKDVVRLAQASIARGPHAFGFAWVDASGCLHHFKMAGKLTEHTGLLARVATEAVAMIAHLRFTTHGDPESNANNHPHPIDGGWLVHNGIVRNYDQLVSEHRLWLNSDCDSEVFGLLAEQQDGSSTAMERLASAIEMTEGSHAVMALWNRPLRLVVARRGNPLHMAPIDGDKGWLFSTVNCGLPATVPMRDSYICSVGKKAEAEEARDLYADESAEAGLWASVRGGEYRGG